MGGGCFRSAGSDLFRSIPLFGATAWWAFYAEREQGFTATEVGFYLLFGYGLGCVGYPICARLMTSVGYRPTAIGFLLGAAVACAVLFQTTDRILMFIALIFAVGLGLGCEPALSGFAAELFPTPVRGQASAWVRSWFALPGIVLGPALVGVIGDPQTGIGSIGDAVTWLTVLLDSSRAADLAGGAGTRRPRARGHRAGLTGSWLSVRHVRVASLRA